MKVSHPLFDALAGLSWDFRLACFSRQILIKSVLSHYVSSSLEIRWSLKLCGSLITLMMWIAYSSCRSSWTRWALDEDFHVSHTLKDKSKSRGCNANLGWLQSEFTRILHRRLLAVNPGRADKRRICVLETVIFTELELNVYFTPPISPQTNQNRLL